MCVSSTDIQEFYELTVFENQTDGRALTPGLVLCVCVCVREGVCVCVCVCV